MDSCILRIDLETDATFGRGDGLAGVVDQEVEHDEFGLPFLRGRTLKGLLVEECANLVYALEVRRPELAERYAAAANRLFGRPGGGLDDAGLLRMGQARLPADLRRAIRASVKAKELSPMDVLESLTDIRRQTAMDETGKPDEHTLRGTRVILRDTPLLAHLSFATTPDPIVLGLLAACVSALRRAGTSRTRGRGRLRATLCNDAGEDITRDMLDCFATEVSPL